MDERCDLLCVDAPRAEAIRQALLDGDEAQTVADRARALSDPTRLTLAAALREGGELCVCDLSWISGRKQALVSHHLRTPKASSPTVDTRSRLIYLESNAVGSALERPR